jgi:cation transport ATPase
VIEATRVGSQTALAQIIRLVEQAQGSKAPVSAWLIPYRAFLSAVLILAALISDGCSSGRWGLCRVVHTVAVLVIACPCALVWRRRQRYGGHR